MRFGRIKKEEMKANVQNLLAKYFEGNTSLREEADLRDYFNGETVSKELEPYRTLFRFFENEKQLELGNSFDDKLLQQLKKEDKSFKIRSLIPHTIRIAAAITLLVGAFFLYQTINKPQNNLTSIAWGNHEIKDPQLAFEQTKIALLLVSSKLNGGASKAAKEVEKIQKISKFFK
jgi:hypothetical protein